MADAGIISVSTKPVRAALVAVVVSAILLQMTSIGVFKDPNTGYLRNFGTRPGETLFPAWMAMACVGYLVYVMSAGSQMMQQHGSS